ncbi:MAG: hypothetical protein KME05_12410 [Gloeocapsa sp. UFS-A4-WI-NPMV-4B04]|jgi:hypothetical protein|nr:hypothetical protein [Gloeocapsa sp. UFS-A4-WI-NPMV-4B04]
MTRSLKVREKLLMATRNFEKTYEVDLTFSVATSESLICLVNGDGDRRSQKHTSSNVTLNRASHVRGGKEC